MNKNALFYFVLLSIRPDAMLLVGVVYSLVFMVEWLGLIKLDLYIESKSESAATDALSAIWVVCFGESL